MPRLDCREETKSVRDDAVYDQRILVTDGLCVLQADLCRVVYVVGRREHVTGFRCDVADDDVVLAYVQRWSLPGSVWNPRQRVAPSGTLVFVARLEHPCSVLDHNTSHGQTHGRTCHGVQSTATHTACHGCSCTSKQDTAEWVECNGDRKIGLHFVSTILLHRLSTWCGISSVSLQWFTSYLSSRTSTVGISPNSSPSSPLTCGVPQGSVLGTVLFNLYATPLSSLISDSSISHLQYADTHNSSYLLFQQISRLP